MDSPNARSFLSLTKGHSPLHQGSPRSACFNCKMEGHWSRDCPSKGHGEKRRTQISDCDSTNDVDSPDLLCTCGEGLSLLTSHSLNNPNRKFYCCPMPECNFFKWCDELPPLQCPRAQSISSNLPSPQKDLLLQSTIVTDLDKTDVSYCPPHPQCHCGAGWCIRQTLEFGRECFVCSQRNCDYFQWCDAVAPSQKNAASHNEQGTHALSQAPLCSCGAGRARLYRNDFGKVFYGCMIRKGQGACDFFQWYEPFKINQQSSENNLVHSSEEPSISDTDGTSTAETVGVCALEDDDCIGLNDEIINSVLAANVKSKPSSSELRTAIIDERGPSTPSIDDLSQGQWTTSYRLQPAYSLMPR